MNDIAYVEFETVSPLFFDPYTHKPHHRQLHPDRSHFKCTLGAGMIRADLSDQTVVEDVAQKPVTATERYKAPRPLFPRLILVEGNPHSPHASSALCSTITLRFCM